jgi:hypothetical protein
MKLHLKLVPVFLLLVFGALASGSALAQRGGHGYGWGGGPHWGISIGVPLFWPGYYGGYYPYPYAYPGAVAAPPVGYVEQGYVQPAPAQPQGEWYYCAESKSYYPYVRECPGGWQRVPTQPPR